MAEDDRKEVPGAGGNGARGAQAGAKADAAAGELKQYPITYRVDRHDPPLTRSEVTAEEGRGGCHAILLVPMMHGSDGSYSQSVKSLDGRTNAALGSDELFAAWLGICAGLGRDPKLPEQQRVFAREVLAAWADLRESEAMAKDGAGTLRKLQLVPKEPA